MAFHQILHSRALRKPLKDKLDGNPGPSKNGFAEHYPWYALDMLVPIHVRIIALSFNAEKTKQPRFTT